MSSVDLRIANSIATITLQAARTRNAIDINTVRELHGVLDQIQKEGLAVRALVITGSGIRSRGSISARSVLSFRR
jgi:enoyl-CoA hydratase